jgi:protein TonB
VELLADGPVGQVKVLTSSGYSLLDKAAEEAAKSWKHAPATQNGMAVTQWARQVIDFRLDER